MTLLFLWRYGNLETLTFIDKDVFLRSSWSIFFSAGILLRASSSHSLTSTITGKGTIGGMFSEIIKIGLKVDCTPSRNVMLILGYPSKELLQSLYALLMLLRVGLF